MPNNIRAIKFLNWYFLRIGLDDLDFTKPLEWVGGGQGGGDVTKDMIITKSETMPDASSVSTGAVYMYMGETNETYTHGYIYQNIITTAGEHRWERMDVQPMGSSGGAVQISVNGQTTVSGYSVPNPTAEEITAIYNAVVAGNNVQIVDSNNVYYQVILADSMDGAINIEILYFSEMALIYSLEHDVVTIESKKIGGASIDDSSTATDKTWSANKINGLIGNVESLINAL